MGGVWGRFGKSKASRCALALVLLIFAPSLHAAPFVPERDDVVLESLPVGPARSADRALRHLREALEQDPDDLDRAVAYAWKAIESGRRESDPRHFGRAQSALRPWWSESAPPNPVLLLRATLRQNRHEFDPALDDLRLLLSRDPRDAQAWLTRAVIQIVRGELSEARRSCAALLGLGDRLTATTCLAQVASLSGRAERSHTLLAQVFRSQAVGRGREAEGGSDAAAQPMTGDGERTWALASLGDIAGRLGRFEEADRWYAQAAELAPDDAHLLAARADLWLDTGRPELVVERLSGETRHTGLLLRRAIAERRSGHPAYPIHFEALRARFAAARSRGDELHLGEAARFELELAGDSRTALRLARKNFALQREPRDLRVLLETALAERDRAAAEPALALMRETGLEDVALAALARKLESVLR